MLRLKSTSSTKLERGTFSDAGMDYKSSLLKSLRIDRDVEEPSATSRRMRIALICGGGVLALALGGWLLAGHPDAVVVRTATVRPVVAPPEITSGATILDASGYVVARRQTTVSAKITGKIARVLIEEGDRVEQGQILAILDDSNLLAELERARAEVSHAKADLAAADTALNDAWPVFQRNERLIGAKVISQSAFEHAKADFNTVQGRTNIARERLKVAQASLAVAQCNADDATIRAPFTGIVTVKAAQPGEIVSPLSAGGSFTRTGICTIVDMDSLEVDVDISENFIDRVHTQQPATVKLNAYPDWTIPGEVIAIVPTADRSKATVKVRVAFKERDARIIPEMGARVAFLEEPTEQGAVARSGNDVLVPPDAVLSDGDASIVFVVQDQVLKRRSVQLGNLTADGRVITAGLQAGLTVAIGDFRRLQDGATIRIAD